MILVTGANGFVGKALCAEARVRGVPLRAAVRFQENALPTIESVVVGDIARSPDWSCALQGVTCVVHLAARAHRMGETESEPYRIANEYATSVLAKQAAVAGVKRFVFMSTVKVGGEGDEKAYCESDLPSPTGPYAVSKLKAEEVLRKISRETGMEVVILRPPLVYGPGVGANFLRLIRLVNTRIPLPLGSIKNRRSLIYLGNLVDALLVCCNHPQAAGQTYYLSDGAPVSTPQLLLSLGAALQIKPILPPFPYSLLKLLADFLGKGAELQRMTENLFVDDSLMRDQLGWTPPWTLDDGLRETVAWYLSQKTQ